MTSLILVYLTIGLISTTILTIIEHLKVEKYNLQNVKHPFTFTGMVLGTLLWPIIVIDLLIKLFK